MVINHLLYQILVDGHKYAKDICNKTSCSHCRHADIPYCGQAFLAEYLIAHQQEVQDAFDWEINYKMETRRYYLRLANEYAIQNEENFDEKEYIRLLNLSQLNHGRKV